MFYSQQLRRKRERPRKGDKESGCHARQNKDEDSSEKNKGNSECGISQKVGDQAPSKLNNVHHSIIYPNKEGRYQKRYHNRDHHS